jgi:arginyl-tRNA synthetase
MGKEDHSKRFINDKKEITNDKLVFLKVISNVIYSGMKIIGVDTPNKM